MPPLFHSEKLLHALVFSIRVSGEDAGRWEERQDYRSEHTTNFHYFRFDGLAARNHGNHGPVTAKYLLQVSAFSSYSDYQVRHTQCDQNRALDARHAKDHLHCYQTDSNRSAFHQL